MLAVGAVDGYVLWSAHAARIPLSAASLAAEPLVTAPTRPATTTPAARATTAPTPAPGPVTPASPTVDATWVVTVAGRTGIPARAVTAYADAQLAMASTQPGCHITWTMLAGIGVVESSHGRSGGSTLQPDGTTSRTILGPPLDGTNGNKALPATTAGIRFDGDTRWDHAVGPMQFLPSTWMRWGVSADGGVPNPNDIDDAALTAARYLCAAGGDLATTSGWRAAVSAYNAPAVYARKVTNLANTYAQES